MLGGLNRLEPIFLPTGQNFIYKPARQLLLFWMFSRVLRQMKFLPGKYHNNKTFLS